MGARSLSSSSGLGAGAADGVAACDSLRPASANDGTGNIDIQVTSRTPTAMPAARKRFIIVGSIALAHEASV